MSFSMYAKPLPTHVPEPMVFGAAFKHAFAKKWFHQDGSLRNGVVAIPASDSVIFFLEGMIAAGNENLRMDAGIMLEMLKSNPQGIQVWIGEGSDF